MRRGPGGSVAARRMKDAGRGASSQLSSMGNEPSGGARTSTVIGTSRSMGEKASVENENERFVPGAKTKEGDASMDNTGLWPGVSLRLRRPLSSISEAEIVGDLAAAAIELIEAGRAVAGGSSSRSMSSPPSACARE